MSRRLLTMLTVVAVVVLSNPHPAVAVAPPDVPPPPSTVAVDNELLPDRDLDDCVSSLPQPDCGSAGRSGWRQAAVLGVLVAAIAFITWRIVRSARRPERTTTHDA